MSDCLVGTGGWAYFNVPGKSSLKTYSKIFNFVEVNNTFYEYPTLRRVEFWRRIVPKDFVFSVRCHQDLTHKIGLKPVDAAYQVINQMRAYCRVLNSPFLVLETPASYVMDQEALAGAREFFSSLNFKGVRLVWEMRSFMTPAAVGLMQDFNIVQCVDLSKQKPLVESDVVYSRLFGKGKHNLYQFTDEELAQIDRSAAGKDSKVVALSYHGARMYSDAARFLAYKKTGKLMPVTSFVGIESARAVLAEDSTFPVSKQKLIEDQGWKVVDWATDKRVHLSELLSNIPAKTYESLSEVALALELAA